MSSRKELFSRTTITSHSPSSWDNCWHGPLVWAANTHWYLWRYLGKLSPEIYNFKLILHFRSEAPSPFFLQCRPTLSLHKLLKIKYCLTFTYNPVYTTFRYKPAPKISLLVATGTFSSLLCG